MIRWDYDISAHSVEEITEVRERLGLSGEESPERIFCDSEGRCFFDDLPNPEIEAVKHVLNERGTAGWELVQVVYHKDELICFWKRGHDTDSDTDGTD